MRRLLSVFLVTITILAAVRGDRSQYLGGTAPIPKAARVRFDFGESGVVLRWESGTYSLPYGSVRAIEYGDRVGNRIGAAVALGVTLIGLLALPVAFSHKERHYLTVSFEQSDGKPGVMVFESPKSNYWLIVSSFEAKTGLKAEEVKGERIAGSAGAPPRAIAPTFSPPPPAPEPKTTPPEPTPQKAAEPPPAPKPERQPDTQVLRLPG